MFLKYCTIKTSLNYYFPLLNTFFVAFTLQHIKRCLNCCIIMYSLCLFIIISWFVWNSYFIKLLFNYFTFHSKVLYLISYWDNNSKRYSKVYNSVTQMLKIQRMLCSWKPFCNQNKIHSLELIWVSTVHLNNVYWLLVSD